MTRSARSGRRVRRARRATSSASAAAASPPSEPSSPALQPPPPPVVTRPPRSVRPHWPMLQVWPDGQVTPSHASATHRPVSGSHALESGHWMPPQWFALHTPVAALHTPSPHGSGQPVATHAPSWQVSVGPHCTPLQLATQLPPRQNISPGQVTPLHGFGAHALSTQISVAEHFGR